MTSQDERMGTLETKVEGLTKNLDGLDRRVESFRGEVSARFNTTDAKIDSHSQATNAKIDSQSQATNSRIDKLTYIMIGMLTTGLVTLGAVIVGIILNR